MEVVDISSSDSEDDDERIVAVAEAMNIVPVDPVTVVGLKKNPSGQSTFQFSKKVKSRNAQSRSRSPNEHRPPPPHGGIVITPKITSHFNQAAAAPAVGGGSGQKKVVRRTPSEAKQPVRISIPMGGQQQLKIQIGDKKLRRDSNATKKMKCPPKRLQQQQQQEPELVVISDEEDDATPTAGGADRQLTTAIEESIRLDALERVKRALKRKSEPEAGEGRKRVKLERVDAEERHDPVDHAYATLLHVIRSKVKSGEFEKIEKKLGKRIAGIKVEHLSSVTLKEFLEKKRDLIRAETTENHFKHIESVLDELKRYSKPASTASSGSIKPEPVPGTSSSLKPSASNPEDGPKLKVKKIPSRRHISKLENALQKCVKEIRRLEEAEDYDYDEENFDEENTTYIKLDRYRKQATKIYKKLSELKEFDASLGRRQDKKFKFEGSRYPEINAKIAKFINRSRSLGLNCMPEHWEILELIEATNEEKGLGLQKYVMLAEAKDIFRAVCVKLSARRRHDEIVDRDGYLPEDASESVDPADNDEELAKKLGGEKRWREQEERVRVTLYTFYHLLCFARMCRKAEVQLPKRCFPISANFNLLRI